MTVTTSRPADSVPSARDALDHQPMLAADCGPFDELSVEGVLELLPSLSTFPPSTSKRSRSKRAGRSRGTARILGWLLSFPGDGWQERWIVSGADSSLDWIDVVTAGYGCVEASRRSVTTDGLGCLLLARVVRPSYEFLQCYRTSGLYRHAKREFGADLFSSSGRLAWPGE